MDGYRVATSADYALIVTALNAGNEQTILVRSLLRWPHPAYPLLEITRGPFFCYHDRLSGFDQKGAAYELFIDDDLNHHVEIRASGGDWQKPEMGSVQILIKT